MFVYIVLIILSFDRGSTNTIKWGVPLERDTESSSKNTINFTPAIPNNHSHTNYTSTREVYFNRLFSKISYLFSDYVISNFLNLDESNNHILEISIESDIIKPLPDVIKKLVDSKVLNDSDGHLIESFIDSFDYGIIYKVEEKDFTSPISSNFGSFLNDIGVLSWIHIFGISILLLIFLQLWLKMKIRFILITAIATQAVLVEYVRLYQLAIAEKSKVIASDFMSACKPISNMTIIDSIKHFFKQSLTFYEDECLTYYKTVNVDPFYEVSLLEAISSTVRRFIIKHIIELSESIGQAITLLLKPFPFYWKFVVFFSMSAMILFIIITFAGFEFNTLFFKFRRHGNIMSSNTVQSDNTTKTQIMHTHLHKIKKKKHKYISFPSYNSKIQQKKLKYVNSS